MLELITTLYFRTERAAQTSLREFPHRVNAAQTFHPSVFKLTSCLYSRDKETGSDAAWSAAAMKTPRSSSSSLTLLLHDLMGNALIKLSIII